MDFRNRVSDKIYYLSFHSVYFLLKYEWLYLTSGRRYLFRFLSFLFIFTVWIFSTDSNISFIKLFLFNHVNLPIDLIEMPETWQIAIFQKMQKIPRSQNFWGGIHSTAANKSFPQLGSKIKLERLMSNSSIWTLYANFPWNQKTTYFYKLKANSWTNRRN